MTLSILLSNRSYTIVVMFWFISVGVLRCEDVTSTTATQSSFVEKISEKEFRVGKIRINAEEKSLIFPITVNMNEGVVEYALVHKDGKIHESVYSTVVEPKQLQLALLLLSAKPCQINSWPRNHIEIPLAHALDIKIIKKTNGGDVICPLSNSLIYNNPNHTAFGAKPVLSGYWLFNGSKTSGGKFEAQQSGSIISLIADQAALINGLRKGFENDLMHSANKHTLPRVGKRMEMKISIPKQIVRKITKKTN